MLLEGFLDRCDAELVAGWIMDRDEPGRRIALELRVDGRLVAAGTAALFRDDLLRAGKGDGRHGFHFVPPPGTDPARITVAVAGTTRLFAGPRQGLSGLVLPDRAAAPRRFRRCLLHIGTEKTGSTSIQLLLAANRDALAAAGFFVPASLVRPPGKDGISSWGLASYARDDAVQDDPMRLEAGVRGAEGLAAYRSAIAARLDAEAAAAPAHCHTILLSSEHCHSALPTAAEVAGVRHLLAPLAERFEVLAYLRPQIELALSTHAMLVKDGRIDTVLLPGFGAPTPEDWLPFSYFDYAALLARWAEVFGADAVVPRRYLRAALRNGDVIDDFLAWLGLEPAGFTRPAPANASLSAAAQDLLAGLTRTLEAWPPEDARWVRQWVVPRLLRGATGTGHLPARAAAAAFMARFDASNEAVRARWFPELPRLFDVRPDRYPEQATVPETAPPGFHDTLIRMLVVERAMIDRANRGLPPD